MKALFVALLLYVSILSFGQNSRSSNLKTVAEIWGKSYLFHPSVVRSDKQVDWEKALVDFLPSVKSGISNDQFISVLNKNLLSKLDDPFTLVQKRDVFSTYKEEKLAYTSFRNFDYVRLTAFELSSKYYFQKFAKKLKTKKGRRTLVVDLRIKNQLYLQEHGNNCFDAMAMLFLNDNPPMGSLVNREHYGWSETNKSSGSSQKWSVNNIKGFVSESFWSNVFGTVNNKVGKISRPVVFIVNNTFMAYYLSWINALREFRPSTKVIWEKSGDVPTEGTRLLSYKYGGCEFVLNPFMLLGNKHVDFYADRETSNYIPVNENILNYVGRRRVPKDARYFDFTISPKKYKSLAKSLTLEEKMLGLFKIWGVVNYFAPHRSLFNSSWNYALISFINRVEKTSSDKEYYLLIQELMHNMNDSHAKVSHHSLLDYSKNYVAPIKFDWIEKKVIITDISAKVSDEENIFKGDEILSIDGRSVSKIIEEEKKHFSSSTKRAYCSHLFNPFNYRGGSGSFMHLKIDRDGEIKNISISRSEMMYFYLYNNSDRSISEVFKDNIGYINMGYSNSVDSLCRALKDMKDTRGLVLDLRGKPAYDYMRIVNMLVNRDKKGSIVEIPVVKGDRPDVKNFEVIENVIRPNRSIRYYKPIAVLIDNHCISNAEDMAINLSSLYNVFFVGEPTDGTDGEATPIYLPGGGQTSFTGEIVKFGNGEQFQGVGIIPDVFVLRTVSGAKTDRDEILEMALKELKRRL